MTTVVPRDCRTTGAWSHDYETLTIHNAFRPQFLFPFRFFIFWNVGKSIYKKCQKWVFINIGIIGINYWLDNPHNPHHAYNYFWGISIINRMTTSYNRCALCRYNIIIDSIWKHCLCIKPLTVYYNKTYSYTATVSNHSVNDRISQEKFDCVLNI